MNWAYFVPVDTDSGKVKVTLILFTLVLSEICVAL